MILAKVLGSVTATIKHESLENKTLLTVQPVDEKYAPVGNPFIAIDTVQAGSGDIVAILKEGSGARQVLAQKNTPIQAVIVSIIDSVEMPV